MTSTLKIHLQLSKETRIASPIAVKWSASWGLRRLAPKQGRTGGECGLLGCSPYSGSVEDLEEQTAEDFGLQTAFQFCLVREWGRRIPWEAAPKGEISSEKLIFPKACCESSVTFSHAGTICHAVSLGILTESLSLRKYNDEWHEKGSMSFFSSFFPSKACSHICV